MIGLVLLLVACGAAHRGDSVTETAGPAEVSAHVLFDADLLPALLSAIEGATDHIDVSQHTVYNSGSVATLIDSLAESRLHRSPRKPLTGNVRGTHNEPTENPASHPRGGPTQPATGVGPLQKIKRGHCELSDPRRL